MSEIRFDGRVAVITGAGGGLGKTYALELARRGASVVVNDLGGSSDGRGGSSSMADATVKEIIEAGGKAAANYDSVATPEGGKAIIQTALDNFGRVDILVNNAGYYEDAAVWKMDEAVWDRVLGVNLKGTFLCTKAISPGMRERNYGRILNISSVVGQIGIFGTSNYTAAKAGVLGFTKSVAKELVSKGVTVNALALGYFDTGMFRALPKEVQGKIEGEIPLHRPGRLDEVTEPALFLTSEAASYITGQILHVNGGYYM